MSVFLYVVQVPCYVVCWFLCTFERINQQFHIFPLKLSMNAV